jgi:glycosyltransferase involved in cell wall biosynthesis
MKKLLFIDHSHHQKTRATVFLQELLSTHFQVEVIWDQRWSGGPTPSAADLNARGADAILFFQVLPRLRTLRALDCPNITWVPMRDGVDYRRSSVRRLRASPLKVLNFCRETHAFFAAAGQTSTAVQFWPEAQAAVPGGDAPAIFFWARRAEISWSTLKALLGPQRPARIVLRHAPDPGQEFAPPSDADIRDYNISLLEGWMERDAYLAQLRTCNIFMAPRPLEGIGMAMLEAMSHGLAIIAPDAPTMNEYVEHGRGGWLYDLAAPRALDLQNWAACGRSAHAAVAAGRERWLREAAGIAAFVSAAPTRRARWDWRLLQRLGL